MDSKLLSILNTNPAANIATIGFFSNYPVEKYYIENNSVIAIGKSDQLWAHLVCNSSEELSLILGKYNNITNYYYSVENWMIPIILKHGTEDWRMITLRYILDNNINTPLPNIKTIRIDESFASQIFENSEYKQFLSVEYIKDRLRKDISAGISINKKLVAWGFTHDDGALGNLFVLKDHRKKGYGLEVLLSLIQMRKKNNKPVFANILPDNETSIKMVSKLEFKKDREVSWIKLK